MVKNSFPHVSPLNPTGPMYKSSEDCITLVAALIEKRMRVNHECEKRKKKPRVPARIHQLSDAVARIYHRHKGGDLRHYEIEEGWIIEFGQFLISTYAEVTGTEGKKWHPDPQTQFRKKIKIPGCRSRSGIRPVRIWTFRDE